MDDSVITKLRELLDRTGLSYSEVAPAMRSAPSTVRHAIATGHMPAHSGPRLNFARFVAHNENAKRRDEVRFI